MGAVVARGRADSSDFDGNGWPVREAFVAQFTIFNFIDNFGPSKKIRTVCKHTQYVNNWLFYT